MLALTPKTVELHLDFLGNGDAVLFFERLGVDRDVRERGRAVFELPLGSIATRLAARG